MGTGAAAGFSQYVLNAQLAPRAPSASPGPVHSDGLAHLEVGDARTERMNPSRVLMPESEWRPPWQQASFELAHEVQVGVTRTRTSDPDNHLLWTWVGVAHFHQDWVGFPLQEAQRPHQIYLFSSQPTSVVPNPSPDQILYSEYVSPNDRIDPSGSIGT